MKYPTLILEEVHSPITRQQNLSDYTFVGNNQAWSTVVSLKHQTIFASDHPSHLDSE